MAKKPCCDKSLVKKGQWSADEDRRLVSFIEQHGLHCGWVDLPKKAGLQRCGKSCRLRWLNYLRPGLRRGNYSTQEEEIICNLYSLIGSRWSVMASQLQGRTDNDIKNYWNTQLKYKYQERVMKQFNFASAPAGKTEILREATWKYADESSTSSRSSQGHVYDFSSAATAIDTSSQIQYPVLYDPVGMVRAPPSVVASSANEDYMMNKKHVISECSSTSADSGHYSIYNWNESDIANYVANASDYAYAHELSAAPAVSMSASISACTSQSQQVIFQEPLSCPSSSSSVLLEDATFDSLF